MNMCVPKQMSNPPCPHTFLLPVSVSWAAEVGDCASQQFVWPPLFPLLMAVFLITLKDRNFISFHVKLCGSFPTHKMMLPDMASFFRWRHPINTSYFILIWLMILFTKFNEKKNPKTWLWSLSLKIHHQSIKFQIWEQLWTSSTPTGHATLVLRLPFQSQATLLIIWF